MSTSLGALDSCILVILRKMHKYRSSQHGHYKRTLFQELGLQRFPQPSDGT